MAPNLQDCFPPRHNHIIHERDLLQTSASGCTVRLTLHSVTFFSVPATVQDSNQRRCLVSLSLAFVPARRKVLYDFKCSFDFQPWSIRPPTILGFQFLDLAKDTQFSKHFDTRLGANPTQLGDRWNIQGYDKLFTGEGDYGEGHRLFRGIGKGSQRLSIVAEGRLGTVPGAVETVPLCILHKIHEHPPPVLLSNISLSMRVKDSRSIFLSNLAYGRDIKRSFAEVIMSRGPSLPVGPNGPFFIRKSYSSPRSTSGHLPNATEALVENTGEDTPAVASSISRPAVQQPIAVSAQPAQALAGRTGAARRPRFMTTSVPAEVAALHPLGGVGSVAHPHTVHRGLKRSETLPAGGLRRKARAQKTLDVQVRVSQNTPEVASEGRSSSPGVDLLQDFLGRIDVYYASQWLLSGASEAAVISHMQEHLRERLGPEYLVQRPATWQNCQTTVKRVFAEARAQQAAFTAAVSTKKEPTEIRQEHELPPTHTRRTSSSLPTSAALLSRSDRLAERERRHKRARERFASDRQRYLESS